MSTIAAAQTLPPPSSAADVPAEGPRPWLAEVMDDTIGRTGARLGLVWIGVVAFLAVFAPFLANTHPYLLKTDDPSLVRQFGTWSSPLLRYLGGADVALVIVAVAAVALWFSRRLGTAQKLLLFFAVLFAALPITYWKPFALWVAQEHHDWDKFPSRTREMSRLIVIFLMWAADLALLAWILLGSPIPGKVRATYAAILGALAVLLIVFPVNPPVLARYEAYREAQAAGHVQFILRAPLPYSASDRLRDQFDVNRPHPWSPSRGHWLGTERNGADILSRMMHACRIAMAIGFIATGIAAVIGAIIGGLMGYFVGWVDLLGMRLVEIFGSIPIMYLLLAFVAFFERNMYMIMVIIGLTTWVGDARFVRAEFLKLRNQDFVQAAKAAGLPLRSVLFRHMLPNAMAPLLVSASFGIASAILYEATLSYLGLGLIDDPSWGQLLNQALSEGGLFYWWLAIFPGLAIFLTVFAFNLVGEAVRDALDPKLKGIE
jgi:peptide/nickel transport system permease protein